MRIGLDATPLLGRQTGIGRYTAELLRGLASRPAVPGGDEIVATAFTVRGVTDLRTAVPPTVAVRARRMPARLMRQLWTRAEFPSVAWSAGRLDVFHATNFVLPPPGRAAGVVTVHDLSFLRTRTAVAPASLAYRELVPRSVERAAVVLTPSSAVATEVVAQYGCDPARVLVTPLGVDARWATVPPASAEWLRGRGLPLDFVVAVGTLEPRKNLQLLVDAVAELLRADPGGPDLVLVGPDGWGAALDVARLPAGRVHLTGYLADDDLVAVIGASRGLVFPSLYEGFGLPPLEALACGRPVVVSDLPVMREVLGPHATYVPLGDLDALGSAIGALAPRPEDDPASADRRRHAAGYTWSRCTEQTRAAYSAAALHASEH